MRNGREVACKIEDTEERGVSWKTRIEIQSSHKWTGLDRKTRQKGRVKIMERVWIRQ